MSSRHLRRQKKLNDDLLLLNNNSGNSCEGDGDGFGDDIMIPTNRKGTLFALLANSSSSSSASAEEEEKEENDIPFKLKTKTAGKATTTIIKEEEEDIDSLLDRMLLEKRGKEEGAPEEEEEENNSIKLIFSPSLRFMNAEEELRRKFGIKFSNIDEAATPAQILPLVPPPNLSRKQKLSWKRQMALNPNKRALSNSQSKGGNTSIRLFNSHIPWIPISYNKISLTEDFNLEVEDSLEWAQIRDLHSFELMFEFHQREPYNVDCCLAISDYLRMMNQTIPFNNGSTTFTVGAEDFNERALEIIEKGFGGNFFEVLSLSHAPPKTVSYDYGGALNSKLHGALFRKCQFFIKKGTYRCALEWGKTLWSLDTRKDPLGSLLFMDLLAIQSKENIWFWAFYNRAYQRFTPERKASLANWQYSAALLARMEGSFNDSDHFLMSAFEEYPWMIVNFIDTLGLGAGFSCMVSESIKKTFKFSTMHGPYWQQAMARIFASRSGPYWKSIPGIKEWVQESLVRLISVWSDDEIIESDCDLELEMQIPIFRHMILSDMPKVNGSLPPVLDYAKSYDSDPLPIASIFDDNDDDHHQMHQSNISPNLPFADAIDSYL